MKQAIIPAIASSLVTLAGFLIWELTLADSSSTESLTNVDQFFLTAKKNSESISALHLELQEIREQCSPSNELPDTASSEVENLQSNHLIARIETVEDAIEQLSSSQSNPRNTDGESVDTQQALHGAVAMHSYRQSIASEADFETDSGIPLGDYKNTIGDTLHTLEGIEVQNTDCRNITLPKNNPPN